MSVRHLKDRELQDLLENRNSIHYEHLKKCKLCQEEFEFYKILADDLTSLEIPEHDPELSKNIMNSIKAVEVEENKSSFVIWLSSLGATIMAATVVIYLYGYENFLLKLSQLELFGTVDIDSAFSSVGQIINLGSTTTNIMFMAVLTIGFYKLLELLSSKVRSSKVSSLSV